MENIRESSGWAALIADDAGGLRVEEALWETCEEFALLRTIGPVRTFQPPIAPVQAFAAPRCSRPAAL